MQYIINLTFSQVGFWITWLLISVIVELIPSLRTFSYLSRKNRKSEKVVIPEKFPFVTIIVPVYNSEATLFNCLKSIDESSYPNRLMQVICVDNQSSDGSFEKFGDAQNVFNQLYLQWIKTEKGKAKALNAAIYKSMGTYIINIDSDGFLEKSAIENMILKFENKPEISAMTGTILTQKEAIRKTKNLALRLLQRNEYFEYAQSFLAGRNGEVRNNQLFTMAGAFSAFRREVLLSSYLYSYETVGEDTEMTFQIRENLKAVVSICSNAIFFVEPIESLGSLYIQRQRWQRGEIEVVKSFLKNGGKLRGIFKDFIIRRIIIDHTFTFPKMIWNFASIVLLLFGYSWQIIALSYVIIYLLYLLITSLNFINVRALLNEFNQEAKFYLRNFFCIFTLPLYIFLCSVIRLIGIINSIVSGAEWNAKTLRREVSSVKEIVKSDINFMTKGKKNEEH